MRTSQLSRLCRPLAALVFGVPLLAQAQDFIKAGDETFMLNLGGIVNRFDTSVKLNGSARSGSTVGLEGTGLDRNLSSFEASGTWRFLPKHRIDAIYFTGKRTGSKTIDRDIVIDDTTYPVNTTLSAQDREQFFMLDYRYSLVKTAQVEWAGLFGVYGGHYEFDFTSDAPKLGTSASTTVPLPVIGLSVDWTISPRWRASASGAGMAAKVGDADGSIFIGTLSTDYMFTRNLGVGVAYRYREANVDVTKGSFNGSIDAKASSFSAYAHLLF